MIESVAIVLSGIIWVVWTGAVVAWIWYKVRKK